MSDNPDAGTTLDTWTTAAAPAGSGRYYALLHSEQPFQQQQRLITTLISIFSKLGFQSREIEVAKLKLNWWRNELEKDRFDHPVTTALAESFTATGHEISQPDNTLHCTDRLQILLNGYGSLLENGSPSKPESHYQNFHTATGATACQLLCNTDTEDPVVNDVGVVLSKFRCYRYLRQHIDSGLLCLPMTALDAANISPAALTPGNTDSTVQAFLSNLQSELLQSLHTVATSFTGHVNTMPADNRANYKALYIYLQLQIKLLEKQKKDNVSILDQTTKLTPLSNYWCAFKSARQFDRIK